MVNLQDATTCECCTIKITLVIYNRTLRIKRQRGNLFFFHSSVFTKNYSVDTTTLLLILNLSRPFTIARISSSFQGNGRASNGAFGSPMVILYLSCIALLKKDHTTG